MIDIRKLKELVRLMVDNDLSEIDLKDQEEHVVLRRGEQVGSVVNHQPVIYQGGGGVPAHQPRAVVAAEPSEDAASGPEPEEDEGGLLAIESPMVGTFYTAPDPDSEAFVSVGSSVGPDTVVCLVEAMKVFNEIKSEQNGTIERICVSNGEAVEFGQKLFLVRPN